jgi:hypothetical protein
MRELRPDNKVSNGSAALEYGAFIRNVIALWAMRIEFAKMLALDWVSAVQ